VTCYRLGPAALQIRASAWLAAAADDLAEKKRGLEAIVALNPSLDWAQAALTRVWYRWRRENEHGCLAASLPGCVVSGLRPPTHSVTFALLVNAGVDTSSLEVFPLPGWYSLRLPHTFCAMHQRVLRRYYGRWVTGE
jgi:hypothetical protein